MQYSMSDFVGCGKEVAKEAAPLAWEEKIASWLNKGKLLGNKVVARDLYASPAIMSLLKEYIITCMSRQGKVIVLYGEYGTGKSCTIHSIVQEPAEGSWCPPKRMLVTPNQGKSGNDWMQRLRTELQYPETSDAGQFGASLIRTAAKEKSLSEKLLQKLGNTKTKGTTHPRITIHNLACPASPFDKIKQPVIAIDNVEFPYEESERFQKQHEDFFAFALALKDSAHAVGVVVVFATKNLALCKSISILNGFSKICPADISRSDDLASYDDKYKVTETDRRLPRTLALDGTMGWTVESMEKCLILENPGLPTEKAKEIANKYADVRNIRDAGLEALEVIYQLPTEGTLPKVPTKSTGTSTSIDSGELSRPSLVDANFSTSNTAGDESDDVQVWLDAKMAQCGMGC